MKRTGDGTVMQMMNRVQMYFGNPTEAFLLSQQGLQENRILIRINHCVGG